MNLEKLTKETEQAGSLRAEKELDRMIALHEAEITSSETVVKNYLKDVATLPAKACDYNVGTSWVTVLVTAKLKVEYLQNLKKQLA